MSQTTFQNWRLKNPFIESHLFYPEGQKCRWGRIRARWIEKGSDGKNLTHLCAFLFDLQTGDIYLDCRKQKIYAKFVVLSLSRPFFGLTKTVYHLFLPISIPLEIFKAVFNGIQQNHSFKEIAEESLCNVKHNIVDIARTPIYTIALTIVSITAVIIGPFAPNKLYDLRALAGRLEKALNRGTENFWMAAPCFQPLNNVMNIHHQDYTKSNTEYDAEPTLHGLNNLVRSYVKFRRNNRNLFNDCGRLQSKNSPFISSAYPV